MWLQAYTNLVDLNVLFETDWNWLRMSQVLINLQFNYVWLPNLIQINWTIGVWLNNFQTFNCVWLAKSLGEFDSVWSPNPIKIKKMIGVWLSLITERLTDYTRYKATFGCILPPFYAVRNFLPKGNEGSHNDVIVTFIFPSDYHTNSVIYDTIAYPTEDGLQNHDKVYILSHRTSWKAKQAVNFLLFFSFGYIGYKLVCFSGKSIWPIFKWSEKT